jgi:hypothetical protein
MESVVCRLAQSYKVGDSGDVGPIFFDCVRLDDSADRVLIDPTGVVGITVGSAVEVRGTTPVDPAKDLVSNTSAPNRIVSVFKHAYSHVADFPPGAYSPQKEHPRSMYVSKKAARTGPSGYRHPSP